LSAALPAALDYAARGWRVVPICAGRKHPDLPAWQDAATTDPDTIVDWYAERPDRGVGIATGEGSGVFVLDVDLAPGGADTLADLEASYGPLPDTVEAITGSGGRHLYFRHPAGLALTNSAGKLGPGLDIRANGGQVLAPPTIHPTTGQRYAWELEHHPDDVAVADAPGWLLALLTEDRPTTADTGGHYDPNAFEQATFAEDRYNHNPQGGIEVEGLLVRAGWQFHHRDRDGVTYLTRPGKDTRDGTSATIGALDKPGAMRCFTPNAPPFTAETSYDPFDVLRLLRHGGDARAAEAELVAGGWGASTQVSVLGPIKHLADPAAAVMADPALHLPDAFWAARPVLGHIRTAARARLVAPDAVLGVLLTRVAACSPHTLELPPIVGDSMGLTFYAAPVGPPSAGKSAASTVARRLLPAPKGVLDGLPVGSGEGFVDCLFEMVNEEGDDGKKRLVKKQTHYAAIFAIDEGSVLGDLSARSGSTIMPTLRSAFTHSTLGATNASVERRRLLDGHQYVYGVTMGIQPEKAGPLLGDTAGGTPQRFLWLMATDPTIGDEHYDWPGPIKWEPPPAHLLEQLHTTRTVGLRRFQLGLADEIRAEVRAERLADMRGREKDEGDAHAVLVRLKAAALLALLDQRLEVNGEDWGLAGQLVDTSRAVRLAVQSTLSGAEIARNQAIGRRLAIQQETTQRSLAERALRSASRSVGRVVRRHKHEVEGCPRRCLTQAVGGKYRELVSLDDIIDEAYRLEWIDVRGERFVPGASIPA
jgi:hypothetical protein